MAGGEQSALRECDASGIDALADEFERACKAGQFPRIEEYLARVGDDSRPAALRELLKVEVELRRVRHESPDAQEYVARFPRLEAIVLEACRRSDVVLASAESATEDGDATDRPTPAERAPGSEPGSGRLEVRCPSCHAPMEVRVDTPLTDLTCPSCGSHFSLVEQSKETRVAPPLSTLGRFDLIERIGVGGFGSVWKARDKELDRTVAIKIPRAGGMTAEEQEKFFREARAAAQLRHPNIVSVHEVGRDGDSIYIVSDLVRGVTLGDWLTGQRLKSREAAELSAKIADALHHAHEHGVVHRDLKPANIMIDGDRQPHLMDFGLARREVGEVTVTLDGQVVGTPAYMSPEQAQGEAHAADRRSDVYSLGVILFQLLTRELPFRGNAHMIMHQVIHDGPPSPRKLNSNISKDLETITLKCLEKKPDARFRDARELADDLRHYMNGEPIQSHPVGKFKRSLRLYRRNAHLCAGGFTVFTCMLAAAQLLLLAVVAFFTVFAFVFRGSRELLFDALPFLTEVRSPVLLLGVLLVLAILGIAAGVTQARRKGWRRVVGSIIALFLFAGLCLVFSIITVQMLNSGRRSLSFVVYPLTIGGLGLFLEISALVLGRRCEDT